MCMNGFLFRSCNVYTLDMYIHIRVARDRRENRTDPYPLQSLRRVCLIGSFGRGQVESQLGARLKPPPARLHDPVLTGIRFFPCVRDSRIWQLKGNPCVAKTLLPTYPTYTNELSPIYRIYVRSFTYIIYLIPLF